VTQQAPIVNISSATNAALTAVFPIPKGVFMLNVQIGPNPVSLVVSDDKGNIAINIPVLNNSNVPYVFSSDNLFPPFQTTLGVAGVDPCGFLSRDARSMTVQVSAGGVGIVTVVQVRTFDGAQGY
jgi:hypothetical protein